MSRSSVPTGTISVPTGIVGAPTIPGSSNTMISAAQKIQVSNLITTDTLSLLGSRPIAKQVIEPSFDSIIAFLQNLGLASKYFAQQGAKLVGEDYIGPPLQGKSVALSADGSTMAVGGWQEQDGYGATWIFVRDTSGSWTQQARVKGGGIGYPHQGASVALSANGSILAVGGPTNDTSVGSVWIFTRNSDTGVWTEETNLIGSGYVSDAYQGSSVSLSADGSTLAFGGLIDDGFKGATWVFVRDTSGSWSQQGPKLVGSGYVGQCQQGASVSLSSDGTILAVGGPQDNNYVGATWIFTRDSVTGAWSQYGSKLVGTNNEGLDIEQGTSVSISGDGTTIAVGGPYDNTNIGAVWIFVRDSSGAWVQQGPKLTGLDTAGSDVEFGFSVSLTNDGSLLAIGGPADNTHIGALWVFARTFTGTVASWAQLGPKLVGSGYVLATAVSEGNSVAISNDGSTIAVGAFEDNNNIGATWIFTRPA